MSCKLKWHWAKTNNFNIYFLTECIILVWFCTLNRINMAFVSHNWHTIMTNNTIHIRSWHLFHFRCWLRLLECTFQIHTQDDNNNNNTLNTPKCHSAAIRQQCHCKMKATNLCEIGLKTFIDTDKNENK